MMTPEGTMGFGIRTKKDGCWILNFNNLGIQSKWILEPALTELRMIQLEPSPATNVVKRVLFLSKA